MVIGIYWLSSDAGTGKAEFPIGGKLPEFDVQLADGTRLQAGSEVLVLNFWASYCAPCREEAPILSAAHAKEPGAVRVIGLSIEGLPRDKMLQAARELGMRYPLAAVDAAFLARLRVRALPTTYVIARDGVITLSRIGAVTDRELSAAIASAKRRG